MSITNSEQLQWPIGTYYIKNGNDLYLDTIGAGKVNGTDVIVWTLNNGAHQKWKLEHGGIIRNVNSNLVLDAATNGRVCIWQYHGGQNQIWEYDGTFILSKKDNKVLDVKNKSSRPGAQVIVTQKIGEKTQQFKLIPIQ